MMDLYQLEGQNGESVFSIINEYLTASNEFLKNHSPNAGVALRAVEDVVRLQVIVTNEEAQQLQDLANVVRLNPELLPVINNAQQIF